MLNNMMIFGNIGDNETPKYIRIVNAFKESIETNSYQIGDKVPSINQFSKDFSISRDTVYKAYTVLKKQGLIKSTPNKGYYISESRRKVLVLISTFKAYKEVFYHSFMNNIPDNVIVDLQFHHYNIKNFKSMLENDNTRYYKYIVMGFEHPEVKECLSEIDSERLLLIDWKANLGEEGNYVFQDFGKAFYSCLERARHLFEKYNKLTFVYPDFTYHPVEALEFFQKFCDTYNIKYAICTNYNELKVERENAYISVNDRILYELLTQCNDAIFELGLDVGILSYNDTPLKKFTHKGISVISVDFNEFGVKVAEFITSNNGLQTYLTTKLILRDSL